MCEHSVYLYRLNNSVKMSGGIAAELKDRIYSRQWIGGFGERDGYNFN